MTDLVHMKRVVVRPPNWLGDAVLALPAIGAIRRQLTWAHLTIAATPSVAAIFREDTDGQPDQVIELDRSTPTAVATLEGDGFDLGILFPNSLRSAWQFWRAGIPERWGYATAGRGVLLTRRPRRVVRSGVTHQVDYYRDLVRGLGFDCDETQPPRIAPRLPSAERAAALLVQNGIDPGTPLVGFAPGAAYGQAKQWPPDRMGELVARLAARHQVSCVIVGASHDRDAARAIESWLRTYAPDVAGRVLNFAGRTSLGALVGLLSRMKVFVSNDSGAMHLAAALGRPVVAMFGPTDERATRPVGDHVVLSEPVFCRPCLLRDCPIDHRCMKRISVDTVYAAVTARLTAARS